MISVCSFSSRSTSARSRVVGARARAGPAAAAFLRGVPGGVGIGAAADVLGAARRRAGAAGLARVSGGGGAGGFLAM